MSTKTETKEVLAEVPMRFHACEAFLCNVLGKYECTVWLQSPDRLAVPYDQDPKAVFKVDLSKTPDAAIPDDQVQCDVFTPGGLTRLGPRYPKSARSQDAHAAEAALWLSDAAFQKAVIDAKVPYPPREEGEQPNQDQNYRWQALIMRSTKTRYLGFHAKLVAKSGTMLSFKVWTARTNEKDEAVAIDVILDEAAPQMWGGGGGVFQQAGNEGPLFLERRFAKDRNLVTPKLPIGEG